MSRAFLLQGSASVLSLVLGLLLPRWLPESDLSQYLLASTVIQTGALFAMLGTRQTIERSYGLIRERSREAAGVFLSSQIVGRGLATLGAAGLCVGLAYSFRSAGLSMSLVGILIVLVILRSLAELPFHILLSCGKKTAGAWPQTFRYGIRVPTVLLGYHFAGLKGIFLGTAVAELGLACYGWRAARPELLWKWKGIAPPEVRAEWSFARTITVYSIFVIGLNQIGPWTAGWLSSTAAELVDFSMAWQLALQFLNLHYVAQQATVPGLSAVFIRGDTHQFFSLVDNQVRATWIVTSTLVGCLTTIAQPLVEYAFGLPRLELANPLIVGFAAVSAWAMASVYSHALFAAGRARPSAALHGIMLGVAGLFFLWFAPSGGIRILPVLYLAVCVLGWILAVGIYRTATKCPLSTTTFGKISLSATIGLTGCALGRQLKPEVSLALFLTLHLAGLFATGLLRSSQGVAMRKLLRTT